QHVEVIPGLAISGEAALDLQRLPEPLEDVGVLFDVAASIGEHKVKRPLWTNLRPLAQAVCGNRGQGMSRFPAFDFGSPRFFQFLCMKRLVPSSSKYPRARTGYLDLWICQIAQRLF